MKELTKEEQKIIALCPSCHTRVFCEGYVGNIHFIKCPNCNKNGLIFFRKEDKKLEKIEGEKKKRDTVEKEKDAQRPGTYLLLIQPRFVITIVGIVIIVIGIALLINPPSLSLKTGFTLIFIGFLLIFMIFEARKSIRLTDSHPEEDIDFEKKIGQVMPELIVLSIIAWTLFLYFITNDTDFGIFFICTFLGILAAKELTDTVTPIQFKKRMNIFLVVFLIGTVLIIVQRIITLWTFSR